MPAVAIDFRNLVPLEEQLAHASSVLATEDEVPRWIEDLIREVATELHGLDQEAWRETIDPYLFIELERIALGALLALNTDDEEERAQEIEVSLEAMRDLLHDIRENEVVAEGRTPRELSRWLREATQASAQEAAELLGVRRRTFERWLSGESEPRGDDAMRLSLVARLVGQLRHAMTGRGAMLWFGIELPEYGGRTPRELLDDPAAATTLLALAGQARRSDAT
jgi:DNA-binding transcriptional regulator YiaG